MDKSEFYQNLLIQKVQTKELFRLQETSVQDFEGLRLIAEVQVAI